VFVSALSQHPVTAHAVGEVAGAALEELGERPDLALVFVTTAHAGALEDVMHAVDELLHPLVLLGCAATGVVGPHLEVERSAGVALLAGTTGPVAPLWLDAREDPGPDGGPQPAVAGWPRALPFAPSGALVLADPHSFTLDAFGGTGEADGFPVLGCQPSPGGGPGTSRLALGRAVRTDGAVGALLGPATTLDGVVAHGRRAFGRALAVTRAEGDQVLELAGRPALDRLVQQARGLDPDQIERVEHGGLTLGRVVDERTEVFAPDDFVHHAVLGTERGTGALVMDRALAVGATVQFHLRDPASARRDLGRALHEHRADAALLFVGEDRATHFADAGHDVAALTAELGPVPLAGCWSAATLAPVKGRNFAHHDSAAVALLGDHAPPAPAPDGGPGA
jgi:small ligand-binding sensory domain FIST